MGYLLVLAIIIAIIWFSQSNPQTQSTTNPSNASNSRVVPGVGSVYRTKDGLADYRFSFERQADGNYRAYITSMPSYGTRNTSMMVTHRLLDNGRHFVCWSNPLRSLADVKQVAALWADLTQTYIKTGRTIDEQMRRSSYPP